MFVNSEEQEEEEEEESHRHVDSASLRSILQTALAQSRAEQSRSVERHAIQGPPECLTMRDRVHSHTKPRCSAAPRADKHTLALLQEQKSLQTNAWKRV